ncbi:DNA sulfur modification protein DndE [Methylobacterium indicum]|uniref:DNA sulfur modification protein DndE n=1 Tax=Methylobacterium indicum TaxID=1775910 RepID=UPI0007349713|nr:DNA sulfur modification protein DndE [Methylobacterium indicum]KTS25901.1 DNA sulfur modification protein DndE [Methylobacterium indicum]KTS30710.1 DNA sulfur modification protein DndE [Methylobacterium indicum]KTS52506.1 DNA sulfur modification protein DndE [Methylobacterium indicum]
MHYSKLRISKDAASKLRALRQRTGLTPNLLCRIALMVSLEQGPLRDMHAPDEEGSEFNAYTLTGEYGALFAGMLRFVEEGAAPDRQLDDVALVGLLRGHIHRGVGMLSVRVRSALDVLTLIPEEAAA